LAVRSPHYDRLVNWVISFPLPILYHIRPAVVFRPVLVCQSAECVRLRNNGSPVYNERKQRWSVSQNCHLICLTLRHLLYSLPTRLLACVQYQQRIAGLKHMEIVTPDHQLTEQQKTAVWSILCLCQDEFVPPLSRRRSTTQQFISESVTSDHFQPTAYYQELLQQSFLLVQLDHQIIGFLSYKDQHTIQVPSEWNPAAYITTICIHPDYRGRGALTLLYDAIEQRIINQSKVRTITTRTWSTNDAQIHTLEKRGYLRIKTIPDDRGSGIDTIYFGKQVTT